MQYKHAENYNVVVTDQDGDQHLMHANQLVDLGLHHWQGWHCHAGFDYIYLDEKGDVWSGQCQNRYLGNLCGKVDLLAEPDICQKSQCSLCTTDLTVTKTPPL